MPKRMDEFWAGVREPKGVGLCPFCGSRKLKKVRRKWWRVLLHKGGHPWMCTKCLKTFPKPMYWSGGFR